MRFTPSNSENASPLRITAAAGTKFAGAYSPGTVIIVPGKRALQPEGLLHSRGMAGSGLRPLSRFPTAASRRSLGRVSVPVWLIILSDQLRIVGLVSRYLTNYLILRGPV